MAWKIENDRPIYMQLLEQLTAKIVSGEYKPGDKLETVRELAMQAKVNPNTMQRALTELEAAGLIATQRTVGRTITTNTQIIESHRKNIARELSKTYLKAMIQLGNTKQMVAQLILEMEE